MNKFERIYRGIFFQRNTSLYSKFEETNFLEEVIKVSKSDQIVGCQVKPYSNIEYRYYPLFSFSPFLSIKLKTENTKELTELKLEISMHIIPKILLACSLGVVVMYMTFNSHLSYHPGSDGFFALIVVPIVYIMAQLSFWFGSENCKNEFVRIIEFIEKRF